VARTKRNRSEQRTPPRFRTRRISRAVELHEPLLGIHAFGSDGPVDLQSVARASDAPVDAQRIVAESK